VAAMRDEPFPHLLVTVEVDSGHRPVQTRPLFADEMKVLNDHYLKFPWKKPMPNRRGQSAIEAMLEGVLGDEAEVFRKEFEAERPDADATMQDFLGIVLPENELSDYLLKVIMNLLLYEIMLTTFIELEAKPPC
jgi:hypothetical protein